MRVGCHLNVTYAGGLSLAIMFHSDDDISLFVALLDIPVRIGHLFQRIASIYDRFYLPSLNQFCEEDKIFDLLTCWPQTRSRKLYLFAAVLCGP
jgi:hypothetical protein